MVKVHKYQKDRYANSAYRSFLFVRHNAFTKSQSENQVKIDVEDYVQTVEVSIGL